MSMNIPDPEDIGKLFVGGLSSSTTKENLCNYFSQFGEVVDSVVMKNNETGRSRGFGFVTFKDPNCVFKALQINNHELDGKKIDPKECTPRSMQKTRKQAGKCKIFLGGLPPDVTEEAIRSAMSKFGKVDQIVIMYDQDTKKCRGFGFLSFELEESIEQACAERYVIINGKQIECKKAEPRINPRNLSQSYDLTKNQNGFVAQPLYGQVAPVQQNWNSSSNQAALYTVSGSPYPNYTSYSGPGVVTYNTTPPGYAAVSSVPYAQPYPSNFGTPVGGYNYSPIPSSNFAQPTFSNNPQTLVACVQSTSYTSETGKSSEFDYVISEVEELYRICDTDQFIQTVLRNLDELNKKIAILCEGYFKKKTLTANLNFVQSDFSTQTQSLYGPTKAYVGRTAIETNYAKYSSQGALPSSNYQRFHPYKV